MVQFEFCFGVTRERAVGRIDRDEPAIEISDGKPDSGVFKTSLKEVVVFHHG